VRLSFEVKTCIGKRSHLRNGTGLRFELESGLSDDAAESGFAVEFNDRVYAFENRCPHLGVELDWAPGVFFDTTQEYLVCSTHGARFEPDSGKCVSGPCAGQSLTALAVFEEEGELYT
jgi:nitrite reductase/ring-hydroxylating ferredoxin subunit